jgi:hypothetical protein
MSIGGNRAQVTVNVPNVDHPAIARLNFVELYKFIAFV